VLLRIRTRDPPDNIRHDETTTEGGLEQTEMADLVLLQIAKGHRLLVLHLDRTMLEGIHVTADHLTTTSLWTWNTVDLSEDHLIARRSVQIVTPSQKYPLGHAVGVLCLHLEVEEGRHSILRCLLRTATHLRQVQAVGIREDHRLLTTNRRQLPQTPVVYTLLVSLKSPLQLSPHDRIFSLPADLPQVAVMQHQLTPLPVLHHQVEHHLRAPQRAATVWVVDLVRHVIRWRPSTILWLKLLIPHPPGVVEAGGSQASAMATSAPHRLQVQDLSAHPHELVTTSRKISLAPTTIRMILQSDHDLAPYDKTAPASVEALKAVNAEKIGAQAAGTRKGAASETRVIVPSATPLEEMTDLVEMKAATTATIADPPGRTGVVAVVPRLETTVT
jgi:hypothetical protein